MLFYSVFVLYEQCTSQNKKENRLPIIMTSMLFNFITGNMAERQSMVSMGLSMYLWVHKHKYVELIELHI